MPDKPKRLSKSLVQAVIDSLEADGLLVKNGQIRNGQPIYVLPEYLRDKNVIIPDDETKQ
jgi:hypothetical protein